MVKSKSDSPFRYAPWLGPLRDLHRAARDPGADLVRVPVERAAELLGIKDQLCDLGRYMIDR